MFFFFFTHTLRHPSAWLNVQRCKRERMAGFHTKTFATYDHYVTPDDAWQLILPFVPRDRPVWEPFYCDGASGHALGKHGLDVVMHDPDSDFFETVPPKRCVVVSNPPYSQKRAIVTRLVTHEVPFVLLMPAATLSAVWLRKLFHHRKGDDALRIVIPPKRIQFTRVDADSGERHCEGKCNFDTYFFCWRVPVPDGVTFCADS